LAEAKQLIARPVFLEIPKSPDGVGQCWYFADAEHVDQRIRPLEPFVTTSQAAVVITFEHECVSISIDAHTDIFGAQRGSLMQGATT
jgi:hypothetical protein